MPELRGGLECGEKACNKCGELLPLDLFHPHPQGRLGRRGDCKECLAASRRKPRHTKMVVLRDPTERDRLLGQYDHLPRACTRKLLKGDWAERIRRLGCDDAEQIGWQTLLTILSVGGNDGEHLGDYLAASICTAIRVEAVSQLINLKAWYTHRKTLVRCQAVQVRPLDFEPLASQLEPWQEAFLNECLVNQAG